MKIFFYFSIYEKFFLEIARRLKRKYPALEFGGIFYGRIGYARIQKTPFDWHGICLFTDFIRREGVNKPCDTYFLNQKERELGIPNLTLLIASDRAVSKFPRQKALRWLELCIRFVERTLTEHSPDLIVMDDVCCMLSYLIYLVGKKKGLPVWSIGTVKLEDRISFFDDCLDHREKIVRIYQRLQSHPLSPEQIERAETYRRSYVENYKPLNYLKYKGKAPNLSWNYAIKFCQRCVDYFRDPLDLTHLPLGELWGRRFMRWIRYQRSKYSKLFCLPVEGEKYIYYPLQAQPERTTAILAPFYMDQLALIENIAKSLPIDTLLYVKEHPIALGRRLFREFRRLASLFNVRLIRTEVPSHILVRNAQAVITISNTVGIEAIFFERPLLVLGNVFYQFYRNLRYVDNVKDLPYLIPETVASFQPDRQELYRFITAILEGSAVGTRRNPHVVPYVMTERNLQNVADAIEQELRAQFCLQPCAVSPAS